MADVKISALPAATQANAADLIPKVDSIGGATQKLTVAQIINGFAQSGNYAGGAPNWTPIGSLGFAVDTSNSRIWTYFSGAWQ